MFKLKKVVKARKRIAVLTNLLFKLFQISLRYKENRKEYGIEIFEYFYLPWRTDEDFNDAYDQIKTFTLNPKSRLFTIYEMSKKYLKNDSVFLEVGSWKGGVCGLVSLTNENKDIEIFACDSFEGVKKASVDDTFFKNGEYDDATKLDIDQVNKFSPHKIEIVEGTFPDSFKNELINSISVAHIDVDTYLSAKESFEYISERLISGGVVILDDYGGWFTDGVTKFGNELKEDKNYFVIPNHLGQLIIFKI